MSADLHARITASVAEVRADLEGWTGYEDRDALTLRSCDHADDVLARHPCGPHVCLGTVWHDPCIEVRALADLWLGPGRDA